MLKLILPILLAVAGTGAGVGAALYLKPPEAEAKPSDVEAVHDCPEGDLVSKDTNAAKDQTADESDLNHEYAKMNNQFVVPIVTKDRINALVVMGLSIEVKAGNTEIVYSREPKLRDVFLQVMFDHANAGGFEGKFTSSTSMDILRQELRRVAKRVIGDDIAVDVLITEIARQDAI